MTAEEIIKTRDALAAQRNPLMNHWEELAELYMPFRRMDPSGIPDLLSAEDCFDHTPRRAALILANGLASLVTPREELWFEYQAPRALRKDDEAVRFYREASETARELLEASNFYEEIQECYIESPVFGTTALFIGDMDNDGLYFLNQPIKTYYIAEDHRHRVNCIYRDLTLTADQAAGEFGEENLPPEVRSKVNSPEGKTESHDFIHAVYPRKKRNPKAADGKNKPFASVVVHTKTKALVKEDGYDELPYAVHRYRRHGRCPWGFGPGAIAKGEPRQLNFLNQIIDAGTEKAVFPPVIAPAGMEGEIGLGAMEITYIDSTDPNSANILREWAPSGRLDYAQARMMDKRQQIEQAFHVDLFQLFANRQDQRAPLTATEASLVNSEKLSQFSPVFGRLVSEMLDPILNRIFGIMLRNRLLPTPPQSVLQLLDNGKRQAIAAPSVLYKNRILLAMQARQNASLAEYVGLASPLLQFYPEAADVMNFPQIMRDSARNTGLPEAWINSMEVVKQMAEARAAAQQEAQQLAAAETAANVANKIGNTPKDTRDKLGI
jgi:hypothetical protein